MIQCSLPIEKVSKLYATIVHYIEKQDPAKFNPVSVMKTIYDVGISKGHEPKVVAAMMQHVPRMINDLLNTEYFGKIKITPAKMGKLYELSNEFVEEDGIDKVIKALGKKARSKKQTIQAVKTNKKVATKPVEKEPEIEEEPPKSLRLKPFTANKGTLQEYIKVNPNKKDTILFSEETNENRVTIGNTIRRIGSQMDIDDPGMQDLKYNGKVLKLKAIPLDEFAKDNLDLLDSTTRDEISRSQGMVNKGSALPTVAQTKDRIILIVTDEYGNLVKFTDSGEISDTGNIVYQFMHDVRKSGDKFTVTDIYGKEASIASPEVIAKATYVEELDGDYNEYLNKVKKEQEAEFRALYNLRKEIMDAKGEGVQLSISAVSSGVPSDYNRLIVSMNDFIKLPGVDRKTFKTIRTLAKAEGKLSKGSAVIKLNGNEFYIDRPHLQDDVIKEIAEVITNKNIPFKQRLNFLNQFLLPMNQMTPTVRRHEYMFDLADNSMTFGIYPLTVQEVIKAEGKFLDNSQRGIMNKLELGDEALKGLTASEIEEYKTAIIDALSKGITGKDGKPYATKLAFQNELLDNGVYERYDISTGKFVEEDYLDFVMGQKTNITLERSDPGIFNNYLVFDVPSKFSKEINEINDEIKEDLFMKSLREEKEQSTQDPSEIYDNLVSEALSPEFKERVNSEMDVKDPSNNTIYITAKLRQEFRLNPGNKYTQELANDILYVFNRTTKATKFQIEQVEKEIKTLPTETPIEVKPSNTSAQIIEKVVEPEMPQPTNVNNNISLAFDEFDEDSLNRSGELPGNVSRAQIKRAIKWWNSPAGQLLAKYVSLKHVASIVNSDSYAQFVTSAATLADKSMLGEIRISKAKGSMVDVYHEAWHAFSQLFLTREEKVKLYDEVKNYTDKDGNQPHIDKSYLEIEEMLAEDFRTYAKDQKPSKNTPVKNTLFRKIWEFIKAFLSKVGKFLPNLKKDVTIDSMSIPMVSELFENLYMGDPKVMSKYTPLLSNVRFTSLNRGIPSVDNSKVDVLSTQESDQIVASIDSIISQIVDETYKERLDKGIKSSTKSGTLNLLLNNHNRTVTFNKVKRKISERLDQLKDELYKSDKLTPLSKITDLKGIKKNSIGTMVSSKGENKYIFLKSQVDSFDNLVPSIKRGRRVKGESYFDIKIIADFYEHKTIQINNKPVDIIIVTKPEDAQVQFDNYKKGGAQVYTSVNLKTDIATDTLTQDQEEILDKVRILQLTLDHFGDPMYLLNDTKPTGVLSYYVKNSRYGILKKTFDPESVEDSYNDAEELDGEYVDETDSPDSYADTYGDSKTGKKPLDQMANDEVKYIISSLHRLVDGKPVLDRFGFKELADSKRLFNRIAKTINGIQDPTEAFKALVEAQKTFPEFKQLITFKLPNPENPITNTYEMSTVIAFWQTFRRPSVNYYQLMLFPQIEYGEADMFGNRKPYIKEYTSEVVSASLDLNSIINNWKSAFESSKATDFITKAGNNISYLNLTKVFNTFKDANGELNQKKAVEFANAIGIYLDDSEAIKKELKTDPIKYGLSYIFDIVRDVHDLQEQAVTKGSDLSDKVLKFINDFKQNPVKVLTKTIPSGMLKSFADVKRVNQNYNIRNLAELQGKGGYDSVSFGLISADGELVFPNIDMHSVYAQVDALNNMEDLQDAWAPGSDYQYMSYLDPSKNMFTRRSIILNSLYNIKTNKFDKKRNKSVEFFIDNGTRDLNSRTGTKTFDLTPAGKFVQDMHMFLKSGIQEFPRLADKKTTAGIRLRGGLIVGTSTDKNTDERIYVDVDRFLPGGDGMDFGFKYITLQHLAAEFDRIKFVSENKDEVKKIKGPNEIVDSKGRMAAEVFTFFDDILTDEVKEQLYELIPAVNGDFVEFLEAPENYKLLSDIKRDVFNYYKNYTKDVIDEYGKPEMYLDRLLVEKLNLPELSPTASTVERAERDKLIKDTLIKAYVYNNHVHTFEVAHLFFGDLYQFNHLKEELVKRISGGTSGGKGYLNNKLSQNFFNNSFNKNIKDEVTGKVIKPVTYSGVLDMAEGKQVYDNFLFDGKFRTGVIKDAERESIYIDDMVEAWKQDYEEALKDIITDKTAREKAIADMIAEDKAPYEKMTESDGAGVITIDAYRTLKKAENDWSDEQQKLYEKVIKGEKVNALTVREFFPVYKLQMYGPLADTIVPAIGMHKFALNVLMPSEDGNSERQKLHKQMLKKNIQYVLFGSGSKVSTVTKTGEFDNIFKDDTQTEIKDELDITPNVIYLEYLKNVTSVSSTYKGKVTAGTQKRAIMIDGLYNNGEVINPENKPVIDNYNKSVKDFTNVLVAEFLSDIGFVRQGDSYVAKNDKYTKLVNIIRDELGRKQVPEQLIKILDTTLSGKIVADFSVYPEADNLEKIILNVIQRRIVKQKVQGESLVQVPTTLYNGLWDSEFKLVKDPAEVKKLLGTNGLPFYVRGKYNPETKKYGNTSMMKVAISLQGDFVNLLNLPEVKDEADPLAALNALIKNEEWLEKNRQLISITGPRIPTDAINLVSGAEVWHFLDPSAGSKVIVPTEIVAQTGGDFDVDKISFEMPYISATGELVTGVLSNKEFKEALDKAISNKDSDKPDPEIPSPSVIIKLQKKALHNQLIKSKIDILALPENYGALTKPNATYLVDKYADFLQKYAGKYNKLKNYTIKGEKSNPKDPNKKVMSPTRSTELLYNLDKHALAGGRTLGIGAKKNKLHPIFKQIGAKMAATYRSSEWDRSKRKFVPGNEEYKTVLRLKHNIVKNKKGEDVISLGSNRNVKGFKITDINSHNLNGILDRLKNSFPSNLNLVTELIPVINHLLEAGVDTEEVYMFVNQPLIMDYIKIQQELAGIYSVINNLAPAKKSGIPSKAAEYVYKGFLSKQLDTKEVSNFIKASNRDKLLDKLSHINKTTVLNFVPLEGPVMQATVSQIMNTVSSGGSMPSSLTIEQPGVPVDKQKVVFSYSALPTSNDLYYYAAQEAFDRYHGGKTYLSVDELKANITDQDRSSFKALANFLHFIQIERQLRPLSEAEMLFTPDTNYVKTVQQVRKKSKAFEDLISAGRLDEDLIDKFKKSSILSSFFLDDLMLDTTLPLLSLRLNDDISDYIASVIQYNPTLVASVFGPGMDGQEIFSSAYNNGIINFIYQNLLSNSLDETGNVVDIPSSYKGLPVEIDNSIKDTVEVKDNKILINSDLIDTEYSLDLFLRSKTNPESYKTRGLYAFAKNSFMSKSNYVRFVLERERLRKESPLEKLQDNDDYMLKTLESADLSTEEVYEMYLAKRAFMSTFNQSYIFGTGDFSYTDDVLDILDRFKYLKDRYPVAAQLSPQTLIDTPYKILKLNDREAKGDTAFGYYKNLRDLADITIHKADTSENKYISYLFKDFSLMMFYQHGMGYSRSGFTKVLDPIDFVSLMRTAAITFEDNQINDENLNKVAGITLNKNPYKIYSIPSSPTDDSIFEDENEDDFVNRLLGFDLFQNASPEIAAVVSAINEVPTTNSNRAKDTNMFLRSTGFIGFETTKGIPALEEKSSTKLYRESFGELANKGYYTPKDVIAISGSGNFGRAKVDLTEDINSDFRAKYVPEIDKAIKGGVEMFLLGSYNNIKNLQDYNVQKYLEEKGYVARSTSDGYYEFVKTGTGVKNTGDISSTTEEIYSSLPKETQSENVILPKDLDENKTYTGKNFWNKIVPEARELYDNKINRKTGQREVLLIAYRGNKTKTFLQNYKDGLTVGNPFDFANETGTRDEQGITSTKKFLDWMITGNNFGNVNATEEYRQAIINDILSGKLKGSIILYYAEKGYATHATALDYLINKHNWTSESDVTVNILDQIAYLEQQLKDLEEQKRDVLENSFEGIVVSNLPKITPESAKKETGGKVGTNQDINIGLLSSSGVSVEKAAETIWGDYFADTGSNIDDYEVRNVIIDILTKGKANYINELVNQDLIDSTINEINSLKESMSEDRKAKLGTQLDLFAPEEGMISIPRSKKKCRGN